jgi:hypothetical protein
VRVGRPETRGTVAVNATVIAAPSYDASKRRDTLAECGDPTVIFKADEVALAHHDRKISHAALGTARGGHVDQRQALETIVTFDGEVRAEDLQTGADREHVRTVVVRLRESARAQQLRRVSLRTVLTAAEQKEIRGWQRILDTDLHHLNVVATSSRSRANREGVAAVAVGAE